MIADTITGAKIVMNITRIIFSEIDFKWYLEINELQLINITEEMAKELIACYGLSEYNLNRWSQL